MSDQGNPPFTGRRYSAHGILLIESKPTVIFDTVSTKDRTPWLANKEVHSLLQEVWIEADAWLMGWYVVMPDHIHLFAWYTGSLIKYENWVKYWEVAFLKEVPTQTG